VRIAEYYKIASELDYLPSLNAFVRYERDLEAKDTTYPPPPSPGGKNFDQADVQDKYSYGLQLKWNIWDWGTRWGKTEEYEANVARAKVAKDAAESAVRLEVRQAVLSLQGLIDGLESSKSSVRLAEEVYRLTKARFQNGQATSNDVIAAERDQTRARGGLVNVRGDIDLAWLKLQRSMGDKPEIK
jgi:outer membrane protein TolC